LEEPSKLKKPKKVRVKEKILTVNGRDGTRTPSGMRKEQ